ncbi:MAG: tRNA (5-methylaminomethyl-2-thiouridine)(34)-methyltransferase MnmD [Rhizobiaceae bacterium]|nr:tRNA (5-methylaminomethyl-2-thiouridine)(34)-methyltransferase MnmD [Rhizobiaceae bacterium]
MNQGSDATDSSPSENTIEWHADDMPYSTAFGDHYYSRADGRAECAHVFVNGNDLLQRWAKQQRFTIGELGFGTGLNFVETWRQWQASKINTVETDKGQLHFVSFERFPLKASDMARALVAWPALSTLSDQLVSAWPDQPTGVVRIAFDDNVSLEVHIGDALPCMQAWSGMADAWFLDGFSPARNSQMWSLELMSEIYQHTKAGGSFATYSAAGWVRRNLQAAGFIVEKRPGHTGKRDMSIGTRAL